jgi:nanoRNase/pAp phosphatase (c-di-AMP/oligoRNAs hydrolase)
MEKLERLRKIFRKRDRVGILIIPDPDSIACAMALQVILKPCVAASEIVFLTELHRLDNRTMIRLLKIKHRLIREVEIEKYSKLAMVDGQPSHCAFTKDLSIHAIIDHHPDTLEHPVAFSDIRPQYGAAASMLTEYLHQAGAAITPRLATALYYGIKTDTDMFRRTSSHKDLSVLCHLLPKIKIETLRMIEGSEISRKSLSTISCALQDVRFHKTLAYVHLGTIDRDEIGTIMADFLLRIRGIHWSVVSAVYQKNLTIIMRSWKERTNVGRIALRLFKDFGRAGGHRFAARAEVALHSLPVECQPPDDAKMERFVFDRLVVHHRNRQSREKDLA